MHAVANSPPRSNHFGSSGHTKTRVRPPPPSNSKSLNLTKGHGRNENRLNAIEDENSNKPSLKRSRSLAQSTQIHNLNGMKIILFADDSPKNHFEGRFPIVIGTEDDQEAPPRRRLSSTVVRIQSQQPPKDDPSEHTLGALFEANSEVTSSKGGLSPIPYSVCLDEKLDGADHPHIVAESLVVHHSGIHTSGIWDRPQTVFEESTRSCCIPSPTITTAKSAVSPLPDNEHSITDEFLNPAEMSGSLFSGGHESEISIDPLNNFSPRKSTRAKAAAARCAAAVAENLLDQKETLPPCLGDSSVRHKSFESVNHESKGGRSQYSRYDESLLLRKSRRNDTSKTKIRSKVRKDHRGQRRKSPPPETPKASIASTQESVTRSGKVVPTMEEQECQNCRTDHVISGDSSFGNKSSSQEFAQLDLGDQQGIRMVKRSQILTEEDGGLHERKAVLDVSVPNEARPGISGLLRSKMATFRSTSSRVLVVESSNAAAQNAIAQPPDVSVGTGTGRPNLRQGLALFRSQSSRCVNKASVSDQVPPQRSNNDETSPKGGAVGLALRNHFTNFRVARVESKQGIPEDESIALDERDSGAAALPRATLFSNNLLNRLNESISNNLNLNGAALLDDDESSLGLSN